MGIGQAAVTAAGLAVMSGVQPRHLAIKNLQERLIADGASLRRDPERVYSQQRRAQEAINKALAEGLITGLHMARPGLMANAAAPRL